MPVAPEGEWTVEVRLRGTTYGTEEQARATAERWRHLVATSAQRDVELAEVVIRDRDGHRTDECRAVVFHGPGHQSRTPCERYGPHELHEARLVVAGHTAYWRGLEGTTGAFDESPLDEDDPYTYVESKGYWVACCKTCDAGETTPMPYPTQQGRDEWVTAHADGTGHVEFYLVDPPEAGGGARYDEVCPWVGTVAYEGVETTDGRVVEALCWPGLVLGPLPVIQLRTGEPVGTVTEVWRETLGPHGGPVLEEGTPLPAAVEDVPEGAVRIRARGTVYRHAVGPDGRVALGIDVSGDELRSTETAVVLRGGKFRGLTLYPEGSGSTPAWPDAALQLEEVRGAEHPAGE